MNFSVAAIEWSSPQAEAARDIRMKVFVGEQNVPAELELDATDSTAFHVIALDETGNACGTGRLYADDHDAGSAHIGRMAVLPQARGRGCGRAILNALIAEAKRFGYRRIELSAQTHALAFYEKLGFEPFGPEYLDCNIKHRRMQMKLI